MDHLQNPLARTICMKNQFRYVQARPFIYEEDIVAITEVLHSLHLEEGEYVKAFEQKLSEYYHKKFTCVTVNGFAAIHLALIAINISKGDEVIIPAYTCPALLYPIQLVGAKAVYADIASNSFNISADKIERVMTKKTRSIIWPHMFGFPAHMDIDLKWKSLVIEDVAQAMGGSLNGKTLGSLTDISISSFYATKNTTAGDGGAVSINSKKMFDAITEQRYYGGKLKLKPGKQYYNYKMTNLNAALGLSQINHVGDMINLRKKIAAWYDERLGRYPHIHLKFDNKEQSCYHKYPVLFPSRRTRDQFKDELRKLGVNCGYGVLEGLHMIKNSGRAASLENTDAYLKKILCLPIYPGLNEDDIDSIVQRFEQVYKKVF